MSKRLKVPRSSVQTIVRKYKHPGTTQPSYCSGRRRVLSSRDECTLVQKVQINPRTTAKDLVKMLEETGTKVSISTVKTSPISTYPERPLGKEEASAPKPPLKSQTTVCYCTWGQRNILFGEMSSGLKKRK
uniref:Transposase Tc1-like domain-containing protein n=1 Tax=Oncorhynchus tshawytscha TaxID=74940 RepID=A0AAZ3QUS0_ONCTS